jgi:pimeloyl-ACP methyl ester carboxylesterase
VIRSLLNSLLYFPSRAIIETPEHARLDYRDLRMATDDGERLHGWWIDAQKDSLGHLLLCHGNAGNVGDRVLHAALLTATGFDVLLFDYRGYGRSSGRPTEHGTYRDARAALTCLIAQPAVDPARVFYLGESLGGAVALDLALERPPAGLVLLSAFSGVRDLGRIDPRIVMRRSDRGRRLVVTSSASGLVIALKRPCRALRPGVRFVGRRTIWQGRLQWRRRRQVCAASFARVRRPEGAMLSAGATKSFLCASRARAHRNCASGSLSGSCPWRARWHDATAAEVSHSMT